MTSVDIDPLLTLNDDEIFFLYKYADLLSNVTIKFLYIMVLSQFGFSILSSVSSFSHFNKNRESTFSN